MISIESVSVSKDAATSKSNPPLRQFVAQTLQHYLQQLDGHAPTGLYNLVVEEVEIPLFQAILRHTRGNQSKAAEMLGISRSTLRKKLKTYKL